MNMRILSALALSSIVSWTAAHADDSIVMRKQLTIREGLSASPAPTPGPTPSPTPGPTPTPTPTPTPVIKGDWTTSAAVATAPSCSDAAPATRTVWCAGPDGTHLDESACSGAKPATLTTIADHRACGFAWSQDPWSEWASSCSDSATRTRTVSCVRSDGQPAADSSCSGERPDTSETGASLGGCSFAWQSTDWGAWSSTCAANATRERAVTCVRSDGSPADATSCAPGLRPETTETSDNFSGCSYTWKEQDWSTPVPACGSTVQNRGIYCIRSDGSTVADGSCDASSRPASTQPATDYSTCTYGWNAGSYGPWSTTCGAATQTRTVTCQSSDGRTVEDSLCSGNRPDTQQSAYQTSGCGYAWQTGDYGAVTPACGASVQTRPVTCVRSDGTAVEDGSCNAATRPTATQPGTDYSTCSFSWSTTGWSAQSTTCGTSTQTRDVTCLRSDSTPAADGSCASAGTKPEATQTTYPTTGCSYSWKTGDWTTPSPTCGTNYQTRTVECQRSDATTADGSMCTGNKPEGTQTVTDYSSCMSSNTWLGTSTSLGHQIGGPEGTAWTSLAGQGNAYTSYGPYQSNIAPGLRTVTFLLRVDQFQTTGNVVEIDVVSAVASIFYASRIIKGSEIAGTGYIPYTLTYQQTPADISKQVEFRVYSWNTARISVASISIK